MSCNDRGYRFSEARDELRDKAIAFHRQRYLEIGFMPENFQDPHEKDSIYFMARFEGQTPPVAVCRLVIQPLECLATYAHFELFEHERKALKHLRPGTYTELGALTKRPNLPDLVPGLIATALLHASRQGMTLLLCCIDQRFFDMLRLHLELPLRLIGTPKVFHGSIKLPCAVDIQECLARLRLKRPQALQRLEQLADIQQQRLTFPLSAPERVHAALG